MVQVRGGAAATGWALSLDWGRGGGTGDTEGTAGTIVHRSFVGCERKKSQG